MKPKLKIPREVFDKVMHWVCLAGNREISGLGKLKYDEKTNTFEVIDAHVLKQSIQTAGNTEFDGAAIGKFMYQTKDQGSLVWWWHSHHSMAAFWSGTDRECIASFAKDGGVVATVFNNKREHLSACQFKTTSILGEGQVFHDGLETEIITYYPQAKFDDWKAQYEAAELKEVVRDWESGVTGTNFYKSVPPRRLEKLWNKVPVAARKGIVFETYGKIPEEWVWSETINGWRRAYDWDLKVAREFWSPQDVRDYLKDVQQALNVSEADIPTDDDDMPEDFSSEAEEFARSFSGMSEAEWKLLSPYEKDYWKSALHYRGEA